jgi:hypothetical protein
MRIKALGLAAGVAGLVLGGVTAATAASAASAAPAAPHWHIIKTVATNDTGDFTAVVATGTSGGWAFDGEAAAKGPTAWRLLAGKWTPVAFPGKPDEEVVAAAAASPTAVYAFDDNVFGTASRIIGWNGHQWTTVKSFAAGITGASVVTAHDIWVFGYAAAPGIPALGVWHYNGRRWSHVSKTLQGGRALDWNSVWAYNGTSVDHWNGTKWTSTSVKSLLPAALKSHLNDPTVTGILALSATSVFAVGNGNDEDEGGPTVILHFNGHKWTKVASGQYGFGAGQQLSTDGSGGLWLPMPGVESEESYLLHYSAGKLTKATLPVVATKINVSSIARIPGTVDQLAGGFSHATDNRGSNVVAAVLEYS